MPSWRPPWPLYVATTLTWAAIGLPAAVLLAHRPEQLAEPMWSLRAALYFAWILGCFGATRGEVRWNERGRIAFLALQSLSALGLLWSAPRSSAVILIFPIAGEAPFLLPPKRAVLVVAAQTAAIAAIYAVSSDPLQAVVMTVCALGGQVFGLGAGHLAVSEVLARQELARVHAELQATQRLLSESVRDAERVRITRDLHDTLGHHLTALGMNLEVARHLAEGKAAEHVGQAHSLARLLLADVREVVGALHESRAIDLASALTTMIAGVPRPAIHLSLPADLRITDTALAHAVFRCVQEIVTNTLRHANARNLWIDVRRGPGGLSVEARDDGRGAPAYAPGHGLTGMGERLRELGGSLVVASHPGRGFEVHATLPMPEGAG